MGVPRFSLLAVILIVILALAHSSCCRQINRALDQETEPRIRIAKPSSTFPRHLRTIAHFAAFRDKKVKSAHMVSHPRIPGGPNPLHN
ncbi:hypothetical protein I3760_03G097300 [Carya illinoinensis]|nr:hypothetical protein I3760_03G097300 [Carya illinoinensis]